MSYNGDLKLRGMGQEVAITKEQIEEYIRCKEDIIYFKWAGGNRGTDENKFTDKCSLHKYYILIKGRNSPLWKAINSPEVDNG